MMDNDHFVHRPLVRRKSAHSIFGIELAWPKNGPRSPPPTPHRHNSVNFALPAKPLSPGTPNRDGRRFRYCAQTLQPSSASHHHGSVLSLVMRQKGAGPAAAPTAVRRPSTPSVPTFVKAIIRPRSKVPSLLSLDERDSAFVSECSSSSSSALSSPDKRSSGCSCSDPTSVGTPSPWKVDSEQEDARIEREMDKRFAASYGHLLLKSSEARRHNNPRGKWTTSGNEVLVAEGPTQFELLQRLAPPQRRVVQVRRSVEELEPAQHQPNYATYNPNNLKLD